MPDRAIPSVGATVQAHMTLQDGTVGLRLYQPESSSSVGLGTTSFEIDKIPPQPGVPPPRPFYVVLEDKQKLYTNDFWLKFEAATQIVAEIGKTITNTGAWNFAFLVQAAIRIADLEKKLSGLIAASVPADRAKAYSVAADGLAAQAQALSAKTNPVAGDLFLLSATLDTATTIGKSFPS